MEVERSVLGRSWRLRPCDEALALAISQRHGVPEVVGRVLAGRGVQPAEAAAFLSPRLKDWLPDPSHLLDLDRAAERLARAVLGGERVGVIGDYDVDGATATALLVRYLRALGVEVDVVDHHAAEERLPTALAVVNPNRVDQASPLKHLAAVGVTFVVLV